MTGRGALIATALQRGLRKRCPHCGVGPQFTGWIQPVPRCANCGLEFEPNQGDTWFFAIIGDRLPVAATIVQIDSMSAHADANEIMRWLGGFSAPPSMTYLVHGEPVALEALRSRVSREKNWSVQIAQYRQTVQI